MTIDNKHKLIYLGNYFKMYIWITTIIIIFSLLLIISISYKYDKIYQTVGSVEVVDNKFYLKVFIEEKYMEKITEGKIEIKSKINDYKIFSIDQEYYVDEDLNRQYLLLLEIDLDKELLINNMVLEVKFVFNKTTLANEFLAKIRKGMRVWNYYQKRNCC